MSIPDGPALAVVVKGWPRLSETFIAQELAALEAGGFAFDIWSLRHPTDRKTHPLHDRVTGRVRYLPEYLHDAPRRVLRGWHAARRLPGYAEARAMFLRDLKRDANRHRVRRFGQACVLAAELPEGARALYAHFLHSPCHPLCRGDARPALGLFGTCQGHLDLGGVGPKSCAPARERPPGG